MLATSAFELVQQFYHATEIGHVAIGVARGGQRGHTPTNVQKL